MDAYLTLLINGSDSVYIDAIAMLATKAWTWIPLYCAILFTILRSFSYRSALIVIAALILTVVMCDQVASSIFKPLVCRLRPSHDPALVGLIDLVDGYRGGRYGFFSSHAANTIGITTLIGFLLRQRLTVVSLIFWSLFNCWTRVYLGLHFVGDIAAGLAFGILVGYAAYYSLRRWTTVMNDRQDKYEGQTAVTQKPTLSLWLNRYCIPATLLILLVGIAIVA